VLCRSIKKYKKQQLIGIDSAPVMTHSHATGCNTNLRAVIQGGLLHNRETGAPQMDCVLALALQVMRGLQYLHERKVIHGGWASDCT
jgi:hypothetical protein